MKNFVSFKSDFKNEIKDQIKNEVSEAIEVEIRKWEELESIVVVLQQHVKHFQKQMSVLQSENEELEQYGRRLCIRVEGVPTTDNETSKEVLKKVQSLINEIANILFYWEASIKRCYWKAVFNNIPRLAASALRIKCNQLAPNS